MLARMRPGEPSFFLQRNVRRDAPPDARAPLAFHRRLPGYAPTPLLDAPDLARSLGLGQLLIKEESHRLGLTALHNLSTYWANSRAL